MVKRNAIATKLTKRCTQTQKRAFDVAVKLAVKNWIIVVCVVALCVWTL